MAGIAASNPILNPNVPLTGNALLQAARGLTNAQTQPVIQQLAQQITQNQKQTQGAINSVAGYYKGLGNQAQQGVTQTGQVASGLNDQLRGIGQQEQTQLQGIGDHAMSSLLKYAPQTDPSNSLAQPALQGLATEIARQQGLAAQNQGAFQSYGATMGANMKGLAASNLGTFAKQGEQGLKGIAQAGQLRNVPLSQKIAQTQANYENLLANNVGKLRQAQITNGLTMQGLGIKQALAQNTLNQANPNVPGSTAWKNVQAENTAKQLAQNTVHYDNGRLRIDQQNANTGAQNANTKQTTASFANDPNAVGSAAWSRVQRANAQGAPKMLTPAQNNAGARALGAVVNAITTWQRDGMKNSKGVVQVPHPTDDQMKGALGGKYDPKLIEAALELLGYGSINQTTANSLKSAGYNLAGGWTFRNQPIKVTANYDPRNPKQNPLAAVGQGLASAGNAVGKAFGV